MLHYDPILLYSSEFLYVMQLIVTLMLYIVNKGLILLCFHLPIFVQKWFYFISCAFPFIYEITALHGTKFIYIHVDLPIRKGLIIPMHWFE